jgi:hypothetical protein
MSPASTMPQSALTSADTPMSGAALMSELAPAPRTATLMEAAPAPNSATGRDLHGGLGSDAVPIVESNRLGKNPLRHAGKNNPEAPGARRSDRYMTSLAGVTAPGTSSGHNASQDATAPQPERETYYEVTIAADEEFMQLYKRVRTIQSIKAKPGEDIGATFKALMREYITRHSPEEKARRRAKQKDARERRAKRKETGEDPSDKAEPITVADDRPGSRMRHIPAEVRDEVLTRDAHRCTFVGLDGVRCNAARHLQFDHVVPFSRGGDHTPDNLRLLCGVHNRWLAEEMFGPRHGPA